MWLTFMLHIVNPIRQLLFTLFIQLTPNGAVHMYSVSLPSQGVVQQGRRSRSHIYCIALSRLTVHVNLGRECGKVYAWQTMCFILIKLYILVCLPLGLMEQMLRVWRFCLPIKNWMKNVSYIFSMDFFASIHKSLEEEQYWICFKITVTFSLRYFLIVKWQQTADGFS